MMMMIMMTIWIKRGADNHRNQSHHQPSASSSSNMNECEWWEHKIREAQGRGREGRGEG